MFGALRFVCRRKPLAMFNPKEAEKATALPPQADAATEERTKTWDTDELLGSETEAFIKHRGQVYRLRCTRQGKLILYK